MMARQKETSSSMLVPAAFFFGIVVLLAAVMPTFALAALLMLPVGALSLRFTALGNSILQLRSAPQMRGRVLSLWTITYLGSSAIGGPIVGAAGEMIGPRWGLAIGGLAAIFAACVGAVTLRNRRLVLEASGLNAVEADIEDVRIP
jgi:MFS family permease